MKEMTIKSQQGTGRGTGSGGKSAPLRANAGLTHNSLDAFRKLRRGVLEPIPSTDATQEDAQDGARRPSSPEPPAAASSPSLPTAAPQAERRLSDRGAADASPVRAGSAPPRPDTAVSSSTTVTTATTRATGQKRSKSQGARGVQFQSFLDEVPVEACLEYLTRPHTSWDSAVNTVRQRLNRIEELNATMRSRSFASSRAASFSSLNSLNTTMNSVASAPAGFPRSASNGSRSKTGTLRRGRLGTTGSTSPPPEPHALDLAITGESTAADILNITTTTTSTTAAGTRPNTTTSTAAPATSAKSSSSPRARSSGPAQDTSSRTGSAAGAAAHAPRGGTLVRGSVAHRVQAPASSASPASAGRGSGTGSAGGGRAVSPSTRLGSGGGSAGGVRAPRAPPQTKKPKKKSAEPTTKAAPDLFIGPSH